MAAITWSDVVVIAPELSTVAFGWQTVVLAFVNTKVAIDVFDGEDGPVTKMARCYLAAHFGTGIGAGSAGADAPVTSESAGGLARSYATAVASGGTGFQTTAYGGRYVTLARMFAGGAWVI